MILFYFIDPIFKDETASSANNTSVNSAHKQVNYIYMNNLK